MNAKKESPDTQVMNAFAECLRTIYSELGLKIPKEFHPQSEARKILKSLAAHKVRPVTDYAFNRPRGDL